MFAIARLAQASYAGDRQRLTPGVLRLSAGWWVDRAGGALGSAAVTLVFVDGNLASILSAAESAKFTADMGAFLDW